MYYVVQVYGRKEQETIDFIKAEVPSNIAIDVFSPQKIIRKKVRGIWTDRIEKVFPGYVFIESDDPSTLFTALKKVPRFTRLLGRSKEGEYYITLTKEECNYVDILAGRESDRMVGISDITIEPGKQVKVLTGPLAGVKGEVIKYDLHKRLAYINIEMCGRPCEVKVGINIIVEAN